MERDIRILQARCAHYEARFEKAEKENEEQEQEIASLRMERNQYADEFERLQDATRDRDRLDRALDLCISYMTGHGAMKDLVEDATDICKVCNPRPRCKICGMRFGPGTCPSARRRDVCDDCYTGTFYDLVGVDE
ncbi:MAG: hypothetical protein GF414_08590 [Candidatus Altiarchaeales archaeon]|nr:hypothetical protein [Candidatus Altiarchaeales archaeon]